MRIKTLLLTALICALLPAISADAQKKESIESNVNGDITLTQPTQVGSLTLSPGTYAFKNHDSGSEHSIRFMHVTESRELRVTRAFTGWYTDRQLSKAGEVKCRVQPLGAKAPSTTVTVTTEDGTARISQLTIQGKKAVYVF